MIVTACDSYTWNGTTYTSTGIYTKTIQNASGCDSIMALAVTIGHTTTTNNLQNICQGDSYVFNGHTYNVEGNYNDTLNSVLGCDSIIQLTLNVDSLDLSLTLHSDSIISNQSTGSYQWIDCNNANAPIAGEIDQVFTPSLVGIYAMVLTNGTCYDTSACQPFTYVGMENHNISDIQVYPNPGSGLFNVILPEGSFIKVTNIMGSVIYVNEFPEGASTLDLSKFPQGVYLLQITNEKTQKMLYLVIQE